MSFPEVTERPSHGSPTWFVRGKTDVRDALGGRTSPEPVPSPLVRRSARSAGRARRCRAGPLLQASLRRGARMARRATRRAGRLGRDGAHPRRRAPGRRAEEADRRARCAERLDVSRMARARNDILLTDAFEYAAHHHRRRDAQGKRHPLSRPRARRRLLVLEYGGSDSRLLRRSPRCPEDHGGKRGSLRSRRSSVRKVAPHRPRLLGQLSRPGEEGQMEQAKKRLYGAPAHGRTTTHFSCVRGQAQQREEPPWMTLGPSARRSGSD